MFKKILISFLSMLSLTSAVSTIAFSKSENMETFKITDNTENYFNNVDGGEDILFDNQMAGKGIQPRISKSLSSVVEIGDTNLELNTFLLQPSTRKPGFKAQRLDGWSIEGAYFVKINPFGKMESNRLFLQENEKDIFGKKIASWWNDIDEPDSEFGLNELAFSEGDYLYVPLMGFDEGAVIKQNNMFIQYVSFNLQKYIEYSTSIAKDGVVLYEPLPMYAISKNKYKNADEKHKYEPYKDMFEIKTDKVYLNPALSPNYKSDKENLILDDMVKKDGFLKEPLFRIFYAVSSAVQTQIINGKNYLILSYGAVPDLSDSFKKSMEHVWGKSYEWFIESRSFHYIFELTRTSDQMNFKLLYDYPLLAGIEPNSTNAFYWDEKNNLLSWTVEFLYNYETEDKGRVFIFTLDLNEALDPNNSLTIYTGSELFEKQKKYGFTNNNMFYSFDKSGEVTTGHIKSDIVMENNHQNSDTEELVLSNGIGKGSSKVLNFNLISSESRVIFGDKDESNVSAFKVIGDNVFFLRTNPAPAANNSFAYTMYSFNSEAKKVEILSKGNLQNSYLRNIPEKSQISQSGSTLFFSSGGFSNKIKFIRKYISIDLDKIETLSTQSLHLNSITDMNEIIKIDNSNDDDEEKNKKKNTVYVNAIFDYSLDILFRDEQTNMTSQELEAWKMSLKGLDEEFFDLDNEPSNWTHVQKKYILLDENYVFFKYPPGINGISLTLSATPIIGIDIKEIIGKTNSDGTGKFSYADDENPIEGTEKKKVWWEPDYLEFSANIEYKQSDIYSKLEGDLNEAWRNYSPLRKKQSNREISSTPFNEEFGIDISQNFANSGGDEGTIKFSGINGKDVIKTTFSSKNDDVTYRSEINIYLVGVTNSTVDSKETFERVIKEGSDVQAGWIKTDDSEKSISDPIIEQIQLIFAKKIMYFDGEIKVSLGEDTYLDTNNNNKDANKIDLEVTLTDKDGKEVSFETWVHLVEVKPMDITVNFVTNQEDKKMSIIINNYEVIKKAKKKVTYSVNRVVGTQTKSMRAPSDEQSFDEVTGSIIIDQSKFSEDSLIDISISIYSDEAESIKFAQELNQRKSVTSTETTKSNMLWVYIGAAIGGLLLLILVIGTSTVISIKNRKAIKLEKNEILEFKKEYYRNLFINSVEDISNLGDNEVDELKKEVQRIEFNLNDNIEEVDFLKDDEDSVPNNPISESSDDNEEELDDNEEEFDIDSLI